MLLSYHLLGQCLVAKVWEMVLQDTEHVLFVAYPERSRGLGVSPPLDGLSLFLSPHTHNTLQPHRLRMAVANIPDQAQYGGYNFTFTKPVPERFYCNICTKVLHNAQLTFCCGQHFCESCLKHWFTKQKTTCPHCREENFNHVLNKALKREIDDLEIRCTKQGLGCQWVGELSSLQTHLDSDKGCRYVEVQCSNKCGAKTMKRNKLKAHSGQLRTGNFVGRARPLT